MNRQSKTRNSILKVDMGKPATVNKLRLSQNERIQFFENNQLIQPQRARLVKYYDRLKKPKVLFDIPSEPFHLSLVESGNLKKYNFIYAIDTNSKVVNSTLLTVCCVAQCDRINKYCDIKCLFAVKNDGSVTEKIAWVELIQSILKDKNYKSDFVIGIIVDSDYGNISKYNKRELPLINGYYLPPSFELIYASTDSGRENFVNQLISECDRQATQIINNYSYTER
jgi:hypothetical protein